MHRHAAARAQILDGPIRRRADTSRSAASRCNPSIWRRPRRRRARLPACSPSRCMIDVDLAHLDPMLARVADDLGRRVEAHRLRVEQRAGERRRIVAFQPARDIDQMREARGVAFGEAIFAEALDLVEAALGEVGIIAALDHPPDHLLLQSGRCSRVGGRSPSPCAAGWPRRA